MTTFSIRTLTRRTGLPVLAAMLTLGLTGCFNMGGMIPGATGGGTPAGTAAGAQTELVLVNNTRAPIYYVYISPCTAESWGADQLGSNVVMPGSTWTFRMRTGCYDLKAVDRDGREAEERRVQISGSGQRWTLS